MDLDEELNGVLPNRTLGKTETKLAALKEAMQNFAFLKSWMRPATSGAPHEFGLLGLTSTICWQVPFTSSATAFAETVGSLQTCGRFVSCDLDSVFSFAESELQALARQDYRQGDSGGGSHEAPSCSAPLLRLVLLYGRGTCAPSWSPAVSERVTPHPLLLLLLLLLLSFHHQL
eukprot:SAG25_NODE_615_length_6505_cov_8.659694_3_plen_174_part_00